MRVLVACEESQTVCKAFRARGHEAYSCDILPCSGGHPEWHIQDDVLNHLGDGWDMMIAHPPCTYLCNSGVRWLYTSTGQLNKVRAEKVAKSSAFFCTLLRSKIPKIAVENPVPHRHAMLPKYTQIIQPYQFGHGETKKTCLWLKNLPLLKPTSIVQGREQRIWKMPPGPGRSRLRSKTYEGIAAAMADQWGVGK